MSVDFNIAVSMGEQQVINKNLLSPAHHKAAAYIGRSKKERGQKG